VPALFRRLTIRGDAGAVLWHGRTAAVLGAWSIAKQERPRQRPVWMLAARVQRADAFQCRQSPLLFTATRHQGFWCWAIESLDLVEGTVYAILGQPEQ